MITYGRQEISEEDDIAEVVETLKSDFFLLKGLRRRFLKKLLLIIVDQDMA